MYDRNEEREARGESLVMTQALPTPPAPAPAAPMRHGHSQGDLPSLSVSTRGTTDNQTRHMTSGRGRISCSCRTARCLKMYCDCFSSRTYCQDCFCSDCANTPQFEALREQAMGATEVLKPQRSESISSRQSIDIESSRDCSLFRRRRPAPAPLPAPLQSLPARTEEVPSPSLTHQSLLVHAMRVGPGCNCRKSACLKKYCVCFQADLLCSTKCFCFGCQNTISTTPER